MITLNKEILTHKDFTDKFQNELCEMLEALIDAEFQKGDETDFDFIDECADTINAIRSGDTARILPVISRKEFFKRIKGSSFGTAKAAFAVCAAAAIIFGINAAVEKTANVNIAVEIAGFISELLDRNEPIEITEPATSSAEPSTTAEPLPEITDIVVETTPEFKEEYFVGEKFSAEGIRLFAEYSNGERLKVPVGNFTVTVSSDFGSSAKYEKVVISAEGFEKTLKVRVLENLQTKKLSSIYALFPEDYGFTSEDLENLDFSGMQVFAVYSDGSEKELPSDEYQIVKTIEKRLFEEYASVTVSYEDCSCSFTVFKE